MKPSISQLKRTTLLAALGLFIGMAAFGLSVQVTDQAQTGAITLTVPQTQPIRDAISAMRLGGTPVAVTPTRGKRIVISGPRKLHADQNSWAFVRQSATWANGNSTLADNLITALKNTGLLTNNSSTKIQTTTVIGGVTYKLKLETNNSCSPTTACQNVTASAYSGTKSFTHRFKLWRASDGKEALEMLFDDVSTPGTGDGVLLTYRIAVLDPTISNNEDLIVESYITGASPSRRQTYSWGAAFFTSGSQANTTVDRGRVILEEMTVGLKGGGTSSGALCVRIVARTVAATNITACGGAGNHYYTLAYGQKNESNFETTALSGLLRNSMPTNSTICGFDVLKFGVFNGAGFVNDNLTSNNVPSGFPDPGTHSSGYPGVQAVFNKIGTVGAGSGGFDDTTQTTIDGLTSISFHPASESPGF